ncbi:uncharacterized protein LAJ45_10390 [Morchella importuna]|uniref:histidine kinase n=1 Tax=Morchella conica CCBAS932 TaxID=1392247 RepID=A0A3N4KNI4_9PEZI|nr:uncharacterized protein LAJ45_10390 [Morchella importuna]KAH8145589.1 hypothetical protein LAJ45_10390 [Morchella importuna]RPB12070.1 hypothetical protein P167DRAFT_488316 [Morchella conica CCBAS932]
MDAEKSLKSYEAYDHDPYSRASLVIGSTNTMDVVHMGEPGFRSRMEENFIDLESKCLEQTFNLKEKLRSSTTYDFWQHLMEGMSEIMGAQYAFVAKRVLVDDENSAVEMPAIGQPGSCLMGLAFYFNDHKGQSGLYRDYKYQVYGCPCQWMRHDKVLIIPEGLATLTPNNPNAGAMPILPEGYLAVPLFHKGKCFAHFGVMWTADGLRERPQLGWGMLEMFLHALEDQVTDRMLEGNGFTEKPNEVIPQEAVSYRQSLRPYARSLSHELRTPMQGVVGMLDVMYASVLEATEWEIGDMKQIRNMVESLRESIEVAQDSTRRAVDAADNMVHAYDFDMEVPSTPTRDIGLGDDGDDSDSSPNHELDVDEVDSLLNNPRRSKRRRESVSPDEHQPYKMRHFSEGLSYDREGSPLLDRSRRSTNTPSTDQNVVDADRREFAIPNYPSVASPTPSNALMFDASGGVRLNSRPIKLRELLRQIIHDSLRSGGRPDSTRSVETPLGELITVQTAVPGGSISTIKIELTVDETLPETLLLDGVQLSKLLSSVFHNAVKFTENGKIAVQATMKSRFLHFAIADTGEGIPETFLPKLFTAFAREDESLTRSRDGLGLGLMVAKGIARKMGGELWCERTAVQGPHKGSEFRIKLPLTFTDVASAPGTPVVQPGTPLVTPAVLSNAPNPLGTWSLDTGLNRKSPFTGPSPLQDASALPSVPQAARFSPELNPIPQSPPHPGAKFPRGRKPVEYDRNLGQKMPLRILVAEDNKINRKLLINMLKKLGYTEIYEACDGVEAVQIMDVPRERPIDLILMDLWMPRMDGYEAATKILAMPQYADDIIVLAVSADATTEALEKTSRIGMKGFMTKPFKLVDLERLLTEYCADKARLYI